MKIANIDLRKERDSFKYALLSRMQADCEYYLGYGNRNPKHLWAEDEEKQIEYMKMLYGQFDIDKKPQWLTWDKIKEYESKMITRGDTMKIYLKHDYTPRFASIPVYIDQRGKMWADINFWNRSEERQMPDYREFIPEMDYYDDWECELVKGIAITEVYENCKVEVIK